MTEKFEFEALNIDDLDVQELENRLELAMAEPSSGAWFGSGPKSPCGTPAPDPNCNQLPY